MKMSLFTSFLTVSLFFHTFFCGVQGVRDLRIIGIFSETGFGKTTGVQRKCAMQLAIDMINNSTLLPPDIKLIGEYKDDQSSDSQGLVAAYEATQNKTDLIGVIGASASGVSVAIQNYLKYVEVVQISYASTSVQLSDRSQYPYFFRTITSDKYQGSVMAQTLNTLNLKRVSVIYSAETYAQSIFEVFQTTSSQLGINFLVSRSFPDLETDFSDIMDELKAANTKVIVLLANIGNALKVLDAANVNGLTSDYGYTWVGPDGWIAGVNRTTYRVEGMIGFRHTFFESYVPTFLGYCSNFTSMNDKIPLVVDSVYSLTHAIKNLLEEGVTEFDGPIIREALGKVNITNISGDIYFKNQERENLNYEIVNVQSGNLVKVGDGLFTVNINPESMVWAGGSKPDAGAICPDGTYKLNDDCLPCSLGTYRSEDMDESNCLPCEPGTYSPSSNSKLCLLCDKGLFTGSSGASSCTKCPVNEYIDQEGESKCLQCPDNSEVGFEGGKSLEECLCKNGFYLVGQNVSEGCVSCPLGGVCEGAANHPLAIENYWSSAAEPYVFYECLYQNCPGGESESCRENLEGKMCSRCKNGMYPTFDIQDSLLHVVCKECSVGGTITLVVVVFVTLFFIFYIFTPASLSARSKINFFGELTEVLMRSTKRDIFSDETLSLIGPPARSPSARIHSIFSIVWMAIGFCQILYYLYKMNYSWYGDVQLFFYNFGYFNFDKHWLKIECLTKAEDSYFTLMMIKTWSLLGAILISFFFVRFFESLHEYFVGQYGFNYRQKIEVLETEIKDHFLKNHSEDNLYQLTVKNIKLYFRYWGSTFCGSHTFSTKLQYLSLGLLIGDFLLVTVIDASTDIFRCDIQPDGSYTLNSDPSIICFQGIWMTRLLPLSIVGLIVHVVILPWLLFGFITISLKDLKAIFFRKNTTSPDFIIPAKLLSSCHIFHFYQATFPYSHLYFIWEKILFVGFANGLHIYPHIQVTLLFFMLVYICTSVAYKRPFKSYHANNLHTVFTLTKMAVIFLSLLVQFSFSSGLSYLAVSLVVFALFIFTCMTLYHIVQLITSQKNVYKEQLTITKNITEFWNVLDESETFFQTFIESVTDDDRKHFKKLSKGYIVAFKEMSATGPSLYDSDLKMAEKNKESTQAKLPTLKNRKKSKENEIAEQKSGAIDVEMSEFNNRN